MNLWRSWVGVHRWQVYGVLLAISGLLALATRSIAVERVGVQPLVAPVAVSLLVPVVLAVAVAVGCVRPMSTLPDPIRAKVGRAVWVLALTTCGAAVAMLGVAGVREPTPAAVLRNVLLVCALSVATVVLGFPAFTWFAPLLYTIAAMQFGGTSDGGEYWWAVVIDPTSDPAQLVAVGCCYGLGVLLYSLVAQVRHRRP